MDKIDTPSATTPARNIADTLADVLPKPQVVTAIFGIDHTDIGDNRVEYIAVPKSFELKSIDSEARLASPRRTLATAALSDVESFLAYVQRHSAEGSAVWCKFDPQSYALEFGAVFDEIGPGSMPAWRGHKAIYKPVAAAEWKAWIANDGAAQAKDQLMFALFLERHESDSPRSTACLRACR
jgi:uncharacterized protein YfdQ (DUF2303 family)